METVRKKENFIARLGGGFSEITRKFLPDTLAIGLILAVIVFVAGMVVCGQTPLDMFQHFTGSMWNLLAFSMQATVMVVMANVAAGTKTVKKFLNAVASVPKTPTQAIVFGSFICMVLFAVHSTFALIFGAIYAKTVARKIKGIHYPLLAAVCYSGYLTWHCFSGGTIPLLMATEGSWAAELLGYTIPFAEMVFTPVNITLVVVFLITVPFIYKMMMPKQNILEVNPALFEDEKEDEFYTRPEAPTPAQRIEYSRIPTLVLGFVLLLYMVLRLAKAGLNALDLNFINMAMLTLSFLCVDNVVDLAGRTTKAIGVGAGIIIQFPIYAGIMGMVSGSGLGAAIAGVFVGLATRETLPNILSISSFIVHIFVPSGGSKWAIEAPVYIPAAQQLAADIPMVCMATAWGDAVGKLVQPFWAIPLLSIARLSAKDIMGYCMTLAIYAFAVLQIVLFLFNCVL